MGESESINLSPERKSTMCIFEDCALQVAIDAEGNAFRFLEGTPYQERPLY